MNVFGGSQGQKLSCKQACVDLLTLVSYYYIRFFSLNQIHIFNKIDIHKQILSFVIGDIS